MMPEAIQSKVLEDASMLTSGNDPTSVVSELLKENESLKSLNGGLKKELSSFKIENEKNLSLF
jgi:hypothetical protein